MALPLLKVIDSQFGNLMPPQSAREEESEQCAIALAFEPLSDWRLPEQLRLLRRQPVAGTHAQLFEALDTPDTSGQICAQEAAIGSFVRETPDSPKAEIDRPWREVAGLKVHTISQNDSLAKRQARLRAVPIDELVDGVPVAALCIGGRQAVDDGRLRMFEVGQSQYGLRRTALSGGFALPLHDQWLLCH
jgi:hypothetical protein